MMRRSIAMTTRTLLPLLGIALFAASAIAADTHELFYEIRAPKSVKLDELTAFDVVTDQGSESTRLRLTKHREEEGFNVYADSCLLFSGERRRAVIVRPYSGPEPHQVFVLTIPRAPKPADWGPWKRPN